MQAGSDTAPTGRRVAGRIAGALISTAILAAMVVAPAASLAKGGGSGGTVTSWITLSTVNGAAPTHPMLGTSVAFASGYPTTTKNPWISVDCFEGGVLVYGEGGGPSHTFQLGGATSVWNTVGGAASCTAELGDLYWKGGHEYYTYLATTTFSAN